MNKSKYETGDLLFDRVEKIAYIVLGIVYPFSKRSSYYDLLSLDGDENQRDECISVFCIDNDSDIYKCESEKEMVAEFVKARSNIESYLDEKRKAYASKYSDRF